MSEWRRARPGDGPIRTKPGFQLGRILLLGSCVLGCGKPEPKAEPIPFTPAVTEAVGTDPASARGVARTILLLPPETDSLFSVYEAEARRQAGIEHILIDLVHAEGAPASDALAQAIADAARRKIAVVVLVPPADGSTPALEQAIADAKSQGVHFVAMGRTAPPGVDTTAQLRPLREQAGAIVKTALQEARSQADRHFQATRAVVIQSPTLRGPWLAERAQALREAAEAEGLTVGPEISIGEPARMVEAARPIAERLGAPDAPEVLLAVDSPSLQAAAYARSESGRTDALVVAGFSDNEEGTDLVRAGTAEVVARSNVEAVARAAVKLAAQRLAGQTSPESSVIAERIEQPRRPPPGVDLPTRREPARP